MESEALIRNGWTLYGHPIFLSDLLDLFERVERLLEEDEHAAAHSKEYSLLECVVKSIMERVPDDPTHRDFRQGDTLGPKLKHWFRVKKGLPNRYRLFFQFQSKAPKSITYAWFNDETTLRKAGDKSDCYAVFKRLVESGKMPNSYDDLKRAAEALPADLAMPTGS